MVVTSHEIQLPNPLLALVVHGSESSPRPLVVRAVKVLSPPTMAVSGSEIYPQTFVVTGSEIYLHPLNWR